MSKRSFLNIFVVGSGNGLNAVLGLLFFTAVARTLPIDDFGRYALLTSLLVSLSKIMDFGTNSTFVAQSISQQQDLIKNFLSLKFVLLAAAVLIATPLLYVLGVGSPNVLALFLAGTLGYGINITLFAYFQRLEKFVPAVMLNTIPAVLKAGAAGLVFFGFFTPTLEQAFGIFALSILSSISLAPLLPAQFRTFAVSMTDIKNLFLKSAPAGFSQLIKEGWAALANSIAKLARGFSDVGVFSLAHKIGDIFLLVSLSIFTVLLPKNARRKLEHTGYDLTETLLLSGGVLALAAITIVLAKTFTVPIFGEKFSESVGLLSILILAAAITAIHSFMDNYFFVENRTKTLLKITVTKLAIFVGVALATISTLSIKGLALAELTSAAVALVLTSLVIFQGNGGRKRLWRK